jgi:hypothetical protein
MPIPTICPNGCKKPAFEVVPLLKGQYKIGSIVQCTQCGYPIGTLSNDIPIENALRNIEQKITNSKSL